MTLSSSELQHAATWGLRPQPAVKILRWFPSKNAGGTVLGYFSAELPSGLVIHGLRLMRGSAGKLWVAMPDSKRRANDDSLVLNEAGKPIYDKVIEFASGRAREKFGEAILAALQRTHPEAFADGSAA
jgi:DNA-binding cell septation regulator SpoVG